MSASKKAVGWFTMNGKHIPLFEGESKEDAVKRSISKGKEDRPTTKKHIDNKWDEFEKASHKAEIMAHDIDSAEYRKEERKAGRKYDDAVAKGEKSGVITKVTVKKKSVAEKNEDIKNKQIAQAKEQADKAKGVTRKDVEELTAKKDALKGTKLNAKPIAQEEIEAQKKQWGLNKKPTKTKSVSFVTGNGTSQSIGNAMDTSKFKDGSDIMKKNSFLSKYANVSDRAGAYLKHLVENSKQDKDSLLKVLKSNVSGKVDYYKDDNEKYIFRVYDPWGNKSYMYVYKK